MSGPREFFAPLELDYDPTWHVRVDCTSCEATGRMVDGRMKADVTCGACRGAGWGYTLTDVGRAARDEPIPDRRKAWRRSWPGPAARRRNDWRPPGGDRG